MHYECEHGRRIIPRREGPEAFEACEDCPADPSQVRYRPVYGAGETGSLEEKLAATLLHALTHSRPLDWARE